MRYDLMKYVEALEDEIEGLLDSPEWVAEQKMDGTRVTVVINRGEVEFTTGSAPLKHTAATQHIPALTPYLLSMVPSWCGEVTVEGELMIGTGEYRIFDVVHMAGDEGELLTFEDPYEKRRAALGELLPTGPVSLVKCHYTPSGKRELLERVRVGGGEGIILKRLDARYEPGGRTRDVRKIKFVKTADLVVIEVDRRRSPQGRELGSISFGLPAPDGGVTRIGACSVIGKPHVSPGDVIEVAYLYWTGSTTYQPRMVRVREDKAAHECTADQFPTYSREVF